MFQNHLKLRTGVENGDFQTRDENKSILSNRTDDSVKKPTNNQIMDLFLTENEFRAVCDYNSYEISGDLNKLQMMTAKDFDRDRYARYGAHESEIKDYVRTISYINSLKYCSKKYIKDKIVLVVRSGIGLLPLLCVRLGLAKKVIALEQSACIEYSRRIVKDNMYSHMITFIQSSVHDLKKLPHGIQQVDVIVSDFMGDCVIGHGDQMEQVIEARDRFLKPNGLMIPSCVTLYCQLLEHRQIYDNQRLRKYKKKNKKMTDNHFMHKKELDQSEIEANDSDSSSDLLRCSWWSDVYGFDMRSEPEFIENSGVKWQIMTEPIVAFYDSRQVVSKACLLKEFDMYKCTIADVRLVQCRDLKFKCVTPYSSTNGGDYAHMLELFMVVDFPNGIESFDKSDNKQIGFSTSSFSPLTQYRQTGLVLLDQLLVVEGDTFVMNEFHMWRGQQSIVCNPFEKTTNSKSSSEENLKIRLRYTFVNEFMKAYDRRCAYTLTKIMF